MTEARVRRNPFLRVGFWSGLAAGVALPLLLSGVMAGWAAIAPLRYPTTLRSSGAALTSQGGARLTVLEYYDNITLDCRGACDDLKVESDAAPYGHEVRLLDAKGDCVACKAEWATAGDGTRTSTLAGGGVVETTRE